MGLIKVIAFKFQHQAEVGRQLLVVKDGQLLPSCFKRVLLHLDERWETLHVEVDFGIRESINIIVVITEVLSVRWEFHISAKFKVHVLSRQGNINSVVNHYLLIRILHFTHHEVHVTVLVTCHFPCYCDDVIVSLMVHIDRCFLLVAFFMDFIHQSSHVAKMIMDTIW